MCSREDMMRSSVSSFPIRQRNPDLSSAWSTICKFCREDSRKNLTREEKDLLKWCSSNSVQPLLPGLHDLMPPFPGWSPYMMYPPDRLHTLIGFLEMYISQYTLCLYKTSLLPQYKGTPYAEGMGYLDSIVKEFPWKHSVPVKMKLFSGGVSQYCPNLDGKSKKKVTGYGSLGMIDSEDVPLLLLQVLFCKLTCTIHKHFYLVYKHF